MIKINSIYKVLPVPKVYKPKFHKQANPKFNESKICLDENSWAPNDNKVLIYNEKRHIDIII